MVQSTNDLTVHGCVYRMKALLFVLIRHYNFELAVPAEDIAKKSTAVTRPLVKSDPEGGNQLPMLITPHTAA